MKLKRIMPRSIYLLLPIPCIIMANSYDKYSLGMIIELFAMGLSFLLGKRVLGTASNAISNIAHDKYFNLNFKNIKDLIPKHEYEFVRYHIINTGLVFIDMIILGLLLYINAGYNLCMLYFNRASYINIIIRVFLIIILYQSFFKYTEKMSRDIFEIFEICGLRRSKK